MYSSYINNILRNNSNKIIRNMYLPNNKYNKSIIIICNNNSILIVRLIYIFF